MLYVTEKVNILNYIFIFLVNRSQNYAKRAEEKRTGRRYQ